ncbi:methyltransferase family protein [Shimia biformata]|uniref:methyltransferase family protein n=1 Tax=Shimia biformata TaxID=1294299 RepID=UPI00194E9271|nr:isoprenylcysteine carboxylmethyltransferase family protein [Shimia biformata]
MGIRQNIDLPPVWLVGALALAWGQARYWTLGLSFGGAWAEFLGGILVGGGVILMALAATEMSRQKTTIHPHLESDHLVTTGIFKRSRNPIYVGDVLILLGLILYWDAVLSLPLVPIFLWVIERRFVIPEENRLRKKFRAAYARYCQVTRRWL